MANTIDFPVVIGTTGNTKGEYAARFPDVIGATCTADTEEQTIQKSKKVLLDRLRQMNHIPTPSDLTCVAREDPKTMVRLISVDLDQIKHQHRHTVGA